MQGFFNSISGSAPCIRWLIQHHYNFTCLQSTISNLLVLLLSQKHELRSWRLPLLLAAYFYQDAQEMLAVCNTFWYLHQYNLESPPRCCMGLFLCMPKDASWLHPQWWAVICWHPDPVAVSYPFLTTIKHVLITEHIY